jgi:iron(III) transport system permease protein
VLSIVALAMQPAPDVWRHLIDYVLPPTLVDTALLLGSVAGGDQGGHRVADLAA